MRKNYKNSPNRKVGLQTTLLLFYQKKKEKEIAIKIFKQQFSIQKKQRSVGIFYY